MLWYNADRFVKQREKRNKMERVSVRELVEFILRNGDITEYSGGVRDAEVMHKGTRIHKMIQERRAAGYQSEVAMAAVCDLVHDGCPVTIKVEGRADGIIESESCITIDEIKSMLRDVTKMEEPELLHLAQAKCYAAMYAKSHEVDKCIVQMSYCQIDTMAMNEFVSEFSSEEIILWFDELINEYAKWIVWHMRWLENRNASIKNMKFPYEYRKGQYELIKNVYFTILRKKNIFIQAPTGVGKTISTVFPTLSALGEGLSEKIIYLTAKTITRTVAEDTVKLLSANDVMVKCITITAKDKICVLPKAECNPGKCERAKGHFDRVNAAVYDMLTNEQNISRQIIEKYAEKHMVCPYEMSLDVANWCDVVICDYNYAFDPNVGLKRLFSEDNAGKYIFLIDEAHNLVERARSMYSVGINAELVRNVRKSVKSVYARLHSALEAVNRSLLSFKRECDDFAVFESIGGLLLHIMRAVSEYDDFMRNVLPKRTDFSNRENLLQLYFDMRYFLTIADSMDKRYRICGSYEDGGAFVLTLKCMDPSGMLSEYLQKARSSVFFSATLLPVKYYMQQLGADADDYAVYAESSFDYDRQGIFVARDVSTKYTRRNENEYRKIASYISRFIEAKQGNYMVFFTSYKMMRDIYEYMDISCECMIQHENMTEEEKEEFLEAFSAEEGVTKLGLCVLGGIFGEGIDLQDDRLIGTVIVGTGLPMVGDERELFRYYYDENGRNGFDYAYLYPGINKVLQAAGRVIRTASDRGCILLLDDRFATSQYASLFPREWKNVKYVNYDELSEGLKDFWDKY